MPSWTRSAAWRRRRVCRKLMAGRISEAVVEQVRAASDLIEVIGRHVALTKRGVNFFGLCPFHTEKTPSFSVNPERGFYHCFGCGQSGSAFTFLMEVEKLTFPEAVRRLAEEVGIRLDSDRSGAGGESAAVQAYRANGFARTWYTAQLRDPEVGARARHYLVERGVSPGIGERFGLGYAPGGWTALIDRARREGLTPDTLVSAGLAVRHESGRVYDRFRDRLVFPITNPSGRVVAFGGRALEPDAEPKYLNSAESAVYQKGATLYGLDQARDAIRRAGEAIVVEGYMDLLALVEAGIENVLATGGTAFSEPGARVLARHTERAVLCYDGDEAGRRAAARAAEVTLGQGMEVHVALLPDGEDPDSLARASGQAGVLRLVEGALSFLDYIMWIEAPEGAKRDIDWRRRVARRALDAASEMGDPAARELFLREVSAGLGVDYGLLSQSLARRRRPRAAGAGASAGSAQSAALTVPTEERWLLAAMLAQPEVARRLGPELGPEDFSDGSSTAVAEAIREAAGEGLAVGTATLMDQLTEPDARAFLATLDVGQWAEDPVGAEETARACLAKMHRRRLDQHRSEVFASLRDAQAEGDAPRQTQLSEQLRDLDRRRRELAAEQKIA